MAVCLSRFNNLAFSGGCFVRIEVELDQLVVIHLSRHVNVREDIVVQIVLEFCADTADILEFFFQLRFG